MTRVYLPKVFMFLYVYIRVCIHIHIGAAQYGEVAHCVAAVGCEKA